MARFQLSKEEKATAAGIAKKVAKRRRQHPDRLPLLTRSELHELLSPTECVVAEKFLGVNPETYGVTTPLIGMHDPPDGCVPVRNQRYVSRFDGEEKVIRTQYVPAGPYAKFTQMNAAMRRDIGRELLILSGYRSPWYQLLIFVEHYVRFDYRVSRVVKRVALPGYSQHGDPKHTALDVVTLNGEYTARHFPRTDEYAWLRRNGHRFLFREIHLRESPEGLDYEPWHWRYLG